MLRLAAEVGELPSDVGMRRRHLLEGICKLVGGHAACAFSLSRDPVAGPLSMPGTARHFVGLSPRQVQSLEGYLDRPEARDPTVPRVLEVKGTFVTVQRAQLVDDHTWYRCDYFERYRRPNDLDHQLYSRLPLPDGTMLAVAVFRPLGEPAFAEKDCALLDLFHAEAGGLYGTAAERCTPVRAGADVAALPPRHREVLKHLVEGDSEKQVAAKLGLSRHTVHEYVKALYRKLGVSSRGELLARFVQPLAQAAAA